MTIKNFVSPHVHIQSLDSGSVPEAFVKREKQLGTGHITVTDHGSMAACRKVYDLGKKAGLLPILGLEGYFYDDAGFPWKDFGIEDVAEYIGSYYHITLLFQDQHAYETGVRLLSRADDRAVVVFGERKPPFTWADLEELGQTNTIVGSGCLGGMVQDHIVKHGRFDVATAFYEKLRSTFKPGNFFVEVFPHRITHEWTSGVYITFKDGTTEKFANWKNLRIDNGEPEPVKMKAEELARSRKKKYGTLLSVMENRAWVVRQPQEIIGVEAKAEFVQNECAPMKPEGDLQWAANRGMLILAKKYNDPVIVSDDAHFAATEDKIVQDVKLSAMSGSGWRFYGSYHRQDSEEAFAYFNKHLGIEQKEFEGWVDNSYSFASKFKDFKFVDRKQLPTKFYPQDTLRHLFSLIQKHGRMDWGNPVLTARLKSEIDLLHHNGTMDFLPYFFGAEGSVAHYESQGQLGGPGRGSAAGMLTAYLLGITHADPIRYELSQDRFMTPDRIASGKLPDIDQDFGNRDLIIDPENGWLKKTFDDHYAQISVETTLKLRSSVKDVARHIFGKVPSDIEALTKKFQNAPQGITDRNFVFGYHKNDDEDEEWVQGSIEYDKALQRYIADYPEQWEIVQKCLGMVRQRSRHASAFVILNEPVSNFIPLTTVSDVKVTQYDMRTVEAVGGIKMDYLTVNSLNDISDCIRLVRENHFTDKDGHFCPVHIDAASSYTLGGKKVPGVRVVGLDDQMYDIWDLPEDPAVFEDICKGKTESVFQFNTKGAKRWLKLFEKGNGFSKVGLNTIEDLAAFTALDRPGPLDYKIEGKHNMMVEYAHRMRGEPAIGALPILNDLFPETRGVVVFQEQLQKAFQEIGGTTGIQANSFREHIGKKKMELVYKDKTLFMPKAIEKLGADVAEGLWQSMETFGQYGFNKSHAVCYSILGYACAWLKHYYPLEWWTAVLCNADKSEIPEKMWPYCGHLVDLPDVNDSGDTFCIKNGRIKAPLNLLKGIGPEAHKQLCQTKPYKDIGEFCSKMHAVKSAKGRQALHAGVVSKLIAVGSMDSLFPLGSTTIEKLELYREAYKAVFGDSPEIDSKYKFSGAYQKFQIAKQILPEYSASLIKIMTERGEPGFTLEGKNVKYTNEIEGRLQKYQVAPIATVEEALEGELWAGQTIEVACPAYVIEDRRFTYQKDKEASSLTLDIEGAVREFVKWPPRSGKKLPEEWQKQKSYTGCVVVAILQKYREDRPFAIVDVVLVAPAITNEDDNNGK